MDQTSLTHKYSVARISYTSLGLLWENTLWGIGFHVAQAGLEFTVSKDDFELRILCLQH